MLLQNVREPIQATEITRVILQTLTGLTDLLYGLLPFVFHLLLANKESYKMICIVKTNSPKIRTTRTTKYVNCIAIILNLKGIKILHIIEK